MYPQGYFDVNPRKQKDNVARKNKAQYIAELDTLRLDYSKLMTKVIFCGNEEFRINNADPTIVLGEVHNNIIQGKDHHQILKSFHIDSNTLGNFEINRIEEINSVAGFIKLKDVEDGK